MSRHVLAGIFVATLIAGCQAAGPGIRVDVRAEPKTGYKPPANDIGYGGSDLPDAQQQTHDHDFHLIDYRRLDGIVVWAEPVRTAPAADSLPPPINTTVNLSTPNPLKVYLASVGGRVTVRGRTGGGGGGVLRTDAGDLIDVSTVPSVYVPRTPGVVEVLRDDRDEPVATIFVSPTPWAKMAAAPQGVTFAPLPPGQYRVSTWHPILPGGSQVIDVVPGKLSKLTLTVGVNSLPKPK